MSVFAFDDLYVHEEQRIAETCNKVAKNLGVVMIKIVLLVLICLEIIWANNGVQICSSNANTDIAISKIISHLYPEKVKDLIPGGASRWDDDVHVICKAIPSTSKALVIMPYKKVEEKEDDVYTLSLVIALMDLDNKKVLQSFFLPDIEESDAVYISNIELDVTTFSQISDNLTFSLNIEMDGSSRVSPYSEKTLTLYEIKNKSLNTLLDNISIEHTTGENDGNDKGYSTEYLKRLEKVQSKGNYPDLIFEQSFSYNEQEGQTWKAKYGTITYRYQQGKYLPTQSKAAEVFDLKQIEQQAKEGLKFKPIMLKAMLHEKWLTKENMESYNNIAYYLQKAGHNKEAILLLKSILHEFPNRTVAYLNIGDAYLEMSNSFKASQSYAQYIKLMQNEGKDSRIPERIKSIIDDQNIFEKNFIQVYKNKEPISPLILTKKGKAKPVSIIPWKQKVVYELDKEGLLVRVMAYEKDNDIEFIFFVLTLGEERYERDSRYSDGVMSVYRLKKGAVTRLYSYKQEISLADNADDLTEYSSVGWNIFNNDHFDFLKDRFYFSPFGCESIAKNKFYDATCYKYQYFYRDDVVRKGGSYKTKDNMEHLKWNHQHTKFVDEDFKLQSGYLRNGKKVLESEFEYDLEINKKLIDQNDFMISSTFWSNNDRVIYFDNHNLAIACIWRYDLVTKELSKIVPEHEAKAPFAFEYHGKEYVVYIEEKMIKVATPAAF